MASRPTALRSISKIASGTSRRQLHLTGPATYSSVLTETRTSSTRPSDAAEASKRPSLAPADAASGAPAARQFNTSRTLKAVRDTSTIDFAYLPDFGYNAQPEPALRVPLLPDTHYSGQNARAMHEHEPEEVSFVSTKWSFVTSCLSQANFCSRRRFSSLLSTLFPPIVHIFMLRLR